LTTLLETVYVTLIFNLEIKEDRNLISGLLINFSHFGKGSMEQIRKRKKEEKAMK